MLITSKALKEKVAANKKQKVKNDSKLKRKESSNKFLANQDIDGVLGQEEKELFDGDDELKIIEAKDDSK